MQGQPLRQVIANDSPVRDYALFGIFGGHVNITDGRYVYMRATEVEAVQLYNYTLMPTHMRQRFSLEELQSIELSPAFDFTKDCQTMKIPMLPVVPSFADFETLLFDLEADPEQLNPLQDAELEAQLIEHMIDLMRQTDAPVEQFERLGLAVPQTT